MVSPVAVVHRARFQTGLIYGQFPGIPGNFISARPAFSGTAREKLNQSYNSVPSRTIHFQLTKKFERKIEQMVTMMANNAFESLLFAILLAETFLAAQGVMLMDGFKRAKSENLEFSGPNIIQRTLKSQSSTGEVVCGGLCSSPACLGFSFRSLSPDTILCTLASNTSKLTQVTTRSNAYWKQTASTGVKINHYSTHFLASSVRPAMNAGLNSSREISNFNVLKLQMQKK